MLKSMGEIVESAASPPNLEKLSIWRVYAKNDSSFTGKQIQKGYQIRRTYRFGEKTLGARGGRFDKSTEA
ncbi:hypothetical protein TNCV_3579241 [Trichonephila clavipes]|nr:hypothetical protein TNCV_3579241 [Trichonephila clavipes]